jgi:hypothetical protein
VAGYAIGDIFYFRIIRPNTLSETQAIHLLRYALASIWTELETESPSQEDCAEIANQALELTVCFAKGKVPSNSIGLEGWKEYLER